MLLNLDWLLRWKVKIKSHTTIWVLPKTIKQNKGQIENVHRLLRYWVKKERVINNLTQRELDQIIQKIHKYPRRIFKSNKLVSANELENV